MFFDDLFFPDNPKKREQIRQYNYDLRASYQDYCDAWNTWATLLNEAFSQCPVEKYHSAHITLLTKNIQKDTLGECLTEIQTVVNDADRTIKEIIEIMGVEPLLPTGWEKSGIKPVDMEKSTWLEVGKILSTLGLVGITGYLGYYVMSGVIVMQGLIAAAQGTLLSLSGVLGGVALGIVVSAAGFIITDMISSAITGAIERKKLKNALELCKKLDDDVTQPLRKASFTIKQTCFDIKHKDYNLGDNYHLVGTDDGGFEIVKIQYIHLQSANTLSADQPEAMLKQEKRVIRERIPFIPVA